jgi:hypothetical protein
LCSSSEETRGLFGIPATAIVSGFNYAPVECPSPQVDDVPV